MSYEKINFKNREVEKPLTFKKHVNDDGTITLEPKPGTIVEPGTPLLADYFNHMDDGIYKAHEEIDNLKLSGIERNKELVANLNSKKVSATIKDSLKTNIAKVKDIKLGSGNAVASDVLEGKTFSSSSGTDLTGTMPNNRVLSKTITTQGGKQIITPGYYEGGEVKAQFTNLIPENIKSGVSIGGVRGTYKEVKLINTPGWASVDVRNIHEVTDKLYLGAVKQGEVREFNFLGGVNAYRGYSNGHVGIQIGNSYNTIGEKISWRNQIRSATVIVDRVQHRVSFAYTYITEDKAFGSFSLTWPVSSSAGTDVYLYSTYITEALFTGTIFTSTRLSD